MTASPLNFCLFYSIIQILDASSPQVSELLCNKKSEHLCAPSATLRWKVLLCAIEIQVYNSHLEAGT